MINEILYLMDIYKTRFWAKYSWLIFLFFQISLFGNTNLSFDENEELIAVACPELQVDISTVCLQHCADNQYFINYCNIGGMLVEGATVQLTLDTFLLVTATSIPIANQVDNVLTFEVGDLNPDDCGTFQLTAFLDCDAVLGQAHCVEAQIFPDSLCVSPDPDWDESLLEVNYDCQGDSIFFEILNTGDGDMDNPSQFYIIIDDLIVLLDGFQLQSGESTIIGTPTTGGTFHFQAMQAPGYPENSFAGVTVENCQVGPNFTTGFFPQFPQNGSNPSVQVSCMESTDTCIFNNKTAIPEGLGNNKEINANQPIEYQINFQNTTNATLSDLIICDTLSIFLDPATVVAGASSHQYAVEVVNGNVLKFTFENINLPDSMSNFSESYGFVEFTIGQQPNNPPGTVIENDAVLIFEDETAMTNEVFHTIAQPMTTNITIEACEEYDYFGMTITENTTFQDTVDFPLFQSILVTNIEISQPLDTVIFETICQGDFYEYNGELFFETGIYNLEIENSNGCIDLVEIQLEVIEVFDIYFTEVICEGESFTYNGVDYTETGTYQDFDISPEGCPVPVFIDLSVNPMQEEFFFDAICQGQTYFFEGQPFFETGEYFFQYVNQFGCDSTIILQLDVLPPDNIYFNETICEGEVFNTNGFSFSETGNYFQIIFNDEGCEENLEVDLTVLPNSQTNLNETICEGDTLSVGNETFSESGDYSIILTSENGCDSIIFLTLFIETKPFTCTASAGNDTLICGLQTLLTGTPAGGEWSAIGDTTLGNPAFVWVNNTMTEVAVLECGEYLFAYAATSFDSLLMYDEMLMDSVLVVDTCVAIDTVRVEFLDADLTLNTTAACENESNGSLEISLNTPNDDLTFSLDKQNFQTDFSFENLDHDTYALYFLNQEQCLDSLPFLIEEIPLLPEIALEKEYHFCGEGDAAIVEVPLNYDASLVNFSWSNGATDAATFFQEAGQQSVEISTACETQNFDFSIINNFQMQQLFMPNAFTPNSDGTNDNFGPIYNLNPDLLELSVYSRWGKQVFHTTDFNQLWDGTADGKKMPSDVYVWWLRAQIPNCQGEIRTFDLKGDVTLIR